METTDILLGSTTHTVIIDGTLDLYPSITSQVSFIVEIIDLCMSTTIEIEAIPMLSYNILAYPVLYEMVAPDTQS